MSKQVKKTNSLVTRQGLRKLASEIMDKFAKEKSALANYYNIKGSGKDLFLIDALIPALDTQGILHDDIINIAEESDQTKILAVSKKIAEWVYSNILKSKSKISNDLSGLEMDFLALREKLSTKKDKPLFAILINDINNLPFDDLDWFQSVVLEGLVSSPGSIVVVTSQNEINWHSWEMRNKCRSYKLPVFSIEETLDLCESRPLAQKIMELSAGHPKTVQSLANAAKQKKALSSFFEDDVNALMEEFVSILKREIDENLNFKEKDQWLREVFYLASAADGFDADLVSDIVADFNKGKDEKEKIVVPEEVTDIAWEMAYTGLAAWDFNEKTYKIFPELRNRIIKYMEHKRKGNYSNTVETIANSYLLRAEILPDWDAQLLRYIYYINMARRLQDREQEGLNEIKTKIDPFLKVEADNQKLVETITREQQYELRSNLKNLYFPLLDFLERGYIPQKSTVPEATNQHQGVEIMSTRLDTRYISESESLGRFQVKGIFRQLLDGQLQDTWIVFIQGNPGIGKSYLLRDLQDIAVREKDIPVAFIDLNYPYSRGRVAIIERIIKQLDLLSETNVSNMFDSLKSTLEQSRTYIGISQADPFEDVYTNTVQAINTAVKNLRSRSMRPVIFVDTFDDNPAVNQLSSWLFNKFIPNLEDGVFFVIAGRKSLDSIKENNEIVKKGIKSIKLIELTDEEIHELIKSRELKGLEFDKDLIGKIIRLSERNPLIVDWIIFYLAKFGRTEDWDELSSKDNPKDALKEMAKFMWKEQSTTGGIPAMKAFHAAIHFGSHFNIDLFKVVVSEGQLDGNSHEKIFGDLAQYFYTRGGPENWTLHDQIRDWMREASKERNSVTEFITFSRKAIEKYYNPKIQDLESKRITLEEGIYLDDLEAQRFFHRLYVEVTHGYKSSDLHLDLWDLLDSLWHRYRLEQMAQVILFGREVQEWKPGAEKDILLTSILDAAQAWAYYSQADYTNAKRYAEYIINREQAPKRLYATAQVILGLLPTQKPNLAIQNLEPAKLAYQQILSQMSNGKLPNNEFTDTEIDIYPEIHQVLMAIGRLHLLHSFDLEKAEKAFLEAFDTARNEDWNQPLYAAVALNELARVLRFEGEYSDALNKTMSAIAMYKKASGASNNDFYLGYFDETIGLIYKELKEYKLANDYLDKALETYNSLDDLDESYRATILLEKGHVYLLEGKYAEAKELLFMAQSIFRASREESPWYYHNSLNKLGEYYLKVNELEKARAAFDELKDSASIYGHELWEYWATQYLAEIDYEEKQKYDKKSLEDLITKFYQNRGRKFGPAFWHTKYLLYKIAKNNEKDVPSALTHLTEGLMYLAGHWKAQFWHNLTLLRTELTNLDINDLTSETERLIKMWKSRFRDEDPAPAFIHMCESLKGSIENMN